MALLAAATAVGAVSLGVGAAPALAADTCPNAAVRAQQGTQDLSDCRAYEQISPVEKHGGSLVGFSLLTRIVSPTWTSAAGNSVLYSTPALEGNDAVRGVAYPSQGVRTDEGWVVRRAINGPTPTATITAITSDFRFLWPSADRTGTLFTALLPFVPDNPEGPDPAGNPSSSAIYGAQGATVNWLSRPAWPGAVPAPGAITDFPFLPIGGSEDLSTAFFMSIHALTADDAAIRPPGASPAVNSAAIYRWRNGALEAAGVLPDGTLDPAGSVASAYVRSDPNTWGGFQQGPEQEYAHPVSRDGRSFTFVSPDPAAVSGRTSQLYLAREGRKTVKLTGTSGVAVTGAVGLPFAVNSEDGRYVVFSSEDALTPDAGGTPAGDRKTYRYDAQTETLTFLPELTVPEADDATVNGAVYAVSNDGSRILFRDATRLRLWRDGASVVDLATGFAPMLFNTPTVPVSRFSADGRTVVFMSREPVNGQADQPDGQIQIYRYSEDGGPLACISCSSALPAGNGKFTNLGAYAPRGGGAAVTRRGMIDVRGISADGKRVFFDTPKPLVAEDQNLVADVYEWRAGSGLRLISQGKAGARATYFADNSESGDDVFFLTADTIGEDRDDLYDLYDARVGGGFASKPPLESCVDTCQGMPKDAPALLRPTSRLGAPVTVGAQKLLKPAKDAVALRVRKGKSSSSRVTLKVSTPGAGKIRARGKGLQTANRRAKRATTYTVRVKLGKHARSTLRRKGRLRVRVEVRFTPKQGRSVAKTVKLTIKRHVRASRKGR